MSQAIRAEQAHINPDFNPSLQHGPTDKERHLFIVNSLGEADQVNLPIQTVFIGDSRGQVDAKVVPLFPEAYPSPDTTINSPELNANSDQELSDLTGKTIENEITGDKTQPWNERVKIYAAGQAAIDKVLADTKYKLTDEEREAQIKFVQQRRFDQTNDEQPVTSEDIDYYKQSQKNKIQTDGPYSAFLNILKDDLNDDEANYPKLVMSDPEEDLSVEQEPDVPTDYYKPHASGSDQKDAFDKFYNLPDVEKSERFEKMRKLGAHITVLWQKANNGFDRLDKTDKLQKSAQVSPTRFANLRTKLNQKIDDKWGINSNLRETELLDIPSVMRPKNEELAKPAVYIKSPGSRKYERRTVLVEPFSHPSVNDGKESVFLSARDGTAELISMEELKARAKSNKRVEELKKAA